MKKNKKIEICEECKYQVDYLDEDKWGKVCGKCGTDMSKYKGFLSYDDFIQSLTKIKKEDNGI